MPSRSGVESLSSRLEDAIRPGRNTIGILRFRHSVFSTRNHVVVRFSQFSALLRHDGPQHHFIPSGAFNAKDSAPRLYPPCRSGVSKVIATEVAVIEEDLTRPREPSCDSHIFLKLSTRLLHLCSGSQLCDYQICSIPQPV